jgi:hypothetical protein
MLNVYFWKWKWTFLPILKASRHKTIEENKQFSFPNALLEGIFNESRVLSAVLWEFWHQGFVGYGFSGRESLWGLGFFDSNFPAIFSWNPPQHNLQNSHVKIQNCDS